MQVVCSAMIFREDMDIGTLTLGDLHKKSTCVKLRVEEIVQSLQLLRSTQMLLFNCGLGVENATDDVVPDIHCTHALLGEEVVTALENPTTSTSGFIRDVQEAMRVESLDAIHLQGDFEDIERIGTQDLSITSLASPLQNTPLRFVSRPPSLTPQAFFCTLHCHNPCAPTLISK